MATRVLATVEAVLIFLGRDGYIVEDVFTGTYTAHRKSGDAAPTLMPKDVFTGLVKNRQSAGKPLDYDAARSNPFCHCWTLATTRFVARR